MKIFNSLSRILTVLKNEKTKFEVALRMYLNTHCVYSVHDLLCIKMIYNIVCKMFIIFYTVKSVYLVYLWLVSHPIVFVADRSGSAVLGVGLRPLAY